MKTNILDYQLKVKEAVQEMLNLTLEINVLLKIPKKIVILEIVKNLKKMMIRIIVVYFQEKLVINLVKKILMFIFVKKLIIKKLKPKKIWKI